MQNTMRTGDRDDRGDRGTNPGSAHRFSRTAEFRWVTHLLAGGVGVAAVLVWLRCVYLVVACRLVTDPAFDPHGYALIGGTVLSVPAAVVAAAAVPFAFPARHRTRVAQITTPVLLVITASLWAAFATA